MAKKRAPYRDSRGRFAPRPAPRRDKSGHFSPGKWKAPRRKPKKLPLTKKTDIAVTSVRVGRGQHERDEKIHVIPIPQHVPFTRGLAEWARRTVAAELARYPEGAIDAVGWRVSGPWAQEGGKHAGENRGDISTAGALQEPDAAKDDLADFFDDLADGDFSDFGDANTHGYGLALFVPELLTLEFLSRPMGAL